MIKPPVRGPRRGNKDHVSREQGELPHSRAEIAHPVKYILWITLEAYEVNNGYRIGDANYVASIKTENV